MIKTILYLFQIIISIVLTTLIFLQSSSDSDSRSNIISTTTSEKRGWEKVMFQATIFILCLFILSSIIQTII